MDNEGVTLAQRKNQLSRRMRMAKKGNESFGRSNGDSFHSNESNTMLGIKRVLDDDPSVSNKRERLSGETQMMAKFHPDYHPIAASSRAGVGGAPPPPPPLPGSFPLPQQNFPFFPAPSPAISGVAMASLSMTANSLGMSLEQFAMTLQSSKNLYQILGQKNNKEAMALNLFANEAKSLYTRSMLLAGYTPAEAHEESPKNVQFAVKALKREYQRLKELAPESVIRVMDAPALEDDDDDEPANTAVVGTRTNEREEHHDEEEAATDGHRHVHSLEGSCGHRAILHQPAGGDPHIDFVVGDTVECYHGIPSTNRNNTMGWLSLSATNSQSGDNLSAADGNTNHRHDNRGGQSLNNSSTTQPQQQQMPRMYRVDELNLDGEEWISDFRPEESGVTGLFELANTRNDKTS